MAGKSCRPGLCNCRDCRKPFTVTVGTIFERSHYPLNDWVYAFSRICASKKGISALQLQRELGCQYKTAWFMLHRIRHAMAGNGFDPLVGEVEADETYVGGKPRKGSGASFKRGRGTKKVPVVALVERGGRARAHVVTDVTAKTLRTVINQNLTPDSSLITDEFSGYKSVGKDYASHRTVTHSAGEYARPDGTNTNTVESYFALIKRGVYGNFHHVSRKHLQRYCDEFSFRWDHRHIRDDERAVIAIEQARGRRLMYGAQRGD